MSSNSPRSTWHAKAGKKTSGLLGAVFGDLGTSPLQTLKVSIKAADIPVNRDVSPFFYGVVLLITWALIFGVKTKFVLIINPFRIPIDHAIEIGGHIAI